MWLQVTHDGARATRAANRPTHLETSMPSRILVLHGPNLNLLEGERSLEAIDARLQARAVALGVQVKCFQSNWEGALLDQLAAERHWFEAVIVNPASLAPNAAALAEALALLKRPAVEVLLDQAKTGRSALKSVVQRQIYGKGPGGYLEALDGLAPKGAAERAKAPGRQAVAAAVAGSSSNGAKGVKTAGRSEAAKPEVQEVRGTKTIGPGEKPRMPQNRPQAAKTIGASRSEPPAEPPRPAKTIGPGRAEAPAEAPRPAKTIGPGRAEAPAEPPRNNKTIGPRKVAQGAEVDSKAKGLRRTTSGELHIGLTRDDVRKKIAERLSGRVSPGGLATWARGQWQELQRGAPCEVGARDKLEDVLQSLLLSTASKASDEQLIDLMTQLG